MIVKTMPPLPSGSVDLSALHAAEAKHEDLTKAIETATTRVTRSAAKPAPAPEPTRASPPPPQRGK